MAFLWWVWLIVRILCIAAGVFTLAVIVLYLWFDVTEERRRKGLR